MQQRAPGGPTDRGLAMLVDQDDTPLFLGADPPHPGRRQPRRPRRGAPRRSAPALDAGRPRPTPSRALGPDTLVATDGRDWATLELHAARGPGRRRGRSHDDLVPALPRGPQRIGYHHSVEEALDAGSRTDSVAVLMPAPDFDLVLRIAAGDRLLPEKATSFQPKPSIGVLIRSLRDE